MFRAAAKAASTYQAGPYDGRMLFVMAGDPNDPAKAGIIAAWRELVGPNLEVVGVPGTHRGEESLMRAPHAESVAAQIQAALTGAPVETREATR
jgi:thioesterase domain-containing protein